MRNCVNYGSVTHSGTVKEGSYIGGVVGYSYGDSTAKISVQNCLNYGIITNNGTISSDMDIGGIAGYSSYALFENCVSAGKIISKENDTIGNVVGYACYNTAITNCFWTNGTGVRNASG